MYTNDKVSHIYRASDSSIVVTLSATYDFIMDAVESRRLAVGILNSIDQRIYWIIDFRNTYFPVDLPISLEEVMIMLDSMYAAVWHHPNVRQVIFVTDDEILKAIVRGLNSEAFGNLHIGITAEMDDALAYARAQKGGTRITYQRPITGTNAV